MKKDLAKINFDLVNEIDGFPPVSVETLNAEIINNNTFKLENTPFFAEGVALGDILSCKRHDQLGGLWYDKILQEGGNSSIAIIFLADDIEEEVFQKLKVMGCYCEYAEFGDLHMLSACVFAEQEYGAVKRFLDEMEQEESLSYAELCIA